MGGGRYIEITVASATRSQLSRQQSNHCQPRPLAETKGLKKLLPGVLKRRIYGVDSGNWQVGTSAQRNGLASKVPRRQEESNICEYRSLPKLSSGIQVFRYIRTAVSGLTVLYLI